MSVRRKTRSEPSVGMEDGFASWVLAALAVWIIDYIKLRAVTFTSWLVGQLVRYVADSPERFCVKQEK